MVPVVDGPLLATVVGGIGVVFADVARIELGGFNFACRKATSEQ